MDGVRAGEGRERKCVHIGISSLDEVFSASCHLIFNPLKA